MVLTHQEQQILDSIIIASENDPLRPEFPANDPKFPATPTYQISVPGFSNVRLKDESYNPTWTHKDRMAWEIVVTYRDFLLSKQRGQIERPLPSMSIISSGSAANAIQTLLKKYGLPNLKVLVDKNIDPSIIAKLEEKWSEVYQTDLNKKALNRNDILNLTHNENWFDITSSNALDPTTRFYDWLSYEIINSSPDYCFIPFGTWNLFENVLNINKKEVSTLNHDPRFSWDIETLRKCNFIGVTTNNPNSKAAEKLYSPHLPFIGFDEQWMRLYRYSGFCGSDSNVLLIKEHFIDDAIKIAQSQNINFEPSWIAWLALLLQMKDSIPKDKKILIVSTGKTKYS